jgi:hypothetical protein
MPLRREILVKGNLYAGNAGHSPDCFNEDPRRATIALAAGPKQHSAVAAAAIAVDEIPHARLIKPHDCIDPPRSIKVGPLIGETQMNLDDGAADGFEIEHAGVASKILAYPRATIRFNLRLRLGVDRPIVKRAGPRRGTGDVAPPARLSIDYCQVGR